MTPPPQCEGERHGQLNLLESAGLLAPACDQATADLARWALLSTLQHRERIKQCKEIRDLDDDLGNGDGEDIGVGGHARLQGACRRSSCVQALKSCMA